MSWQNKARIEQQGNDEEITTPDGYQILVGADEDQVLLWQVGFNNWNLEARTNQVDWSLRAKTDQAGWTLKTKIEQ